MLGPYCTLKRCCLLNHTIPKLSISIKTAREAVYRVRLGMALPRGTACQAAAPGLWAAGHRVDGNEIGALLAAGGLSHRWPRTGYRLDLRALARQCELVHRPLTVAPFPWGRCGAEAARARMLSSISRCRAAYGAPREPSRGRPANARPLAVAGLPGPQRRPWGESPLPGCRPGSCAGTRADSVPPAGQSCRRAATRPPPVTRRAGTAALPREQAGLSAPRQDSAALTAATSAYAFLTSAVRYRSCSQGQIPVRSCAARPTVSQIDDDEAPDGTDHATHQEQASMIRRYIIWATTTHATNDSAASSTRQP